MHKLLKRQLRKLGISADSLHFTTEDWENLLKVVSKTYDESDRSRIQLERSLGLSSQEMRARFQELLSTKEFLSQTEEMGRIGGWSFNLKTQDLYWSDETYRIHELPIGTKIDVSKAVEFYTEKSRPIIESAVEKAVASGEAYDLELELVTETGNQIWVRTLGKVTFASDGTPALLQGTFQDITDQVLAEKENQQLQKQLLQASKLSSIGTLAAGIAHELNNPLTAVSGFAEVIDENSDDAGLVSKFAQRIVIASQRMAKIVNHLRTFSRSNDDSIRKPISPNSCLDDALILLESPLKNENITVHVEPSTGVEMINGDPTQLESIFQNMLTNSRDAFVENKIKLRQIDISFLIKDGFIIINYQDNAGGIPAHIMDNIFDPFFTTKEVGVGTGIGMSITHSIVKGHGGNISVSSEGLTTKFVIELPICRSDFIEPQISTVENPQPPTDKVKRKILIVDDEQDILDLLSYILGRHFEVTIEIDSVKALDLLRRKDFDLVLSDYKMPNVSGLDIVRQLKALDIDMPFVLMTGNGTLDEIKIDPIYPRIAFIQRKPFEDTSDLLWLLWDIASEKAKRLAQDSKIAG